MVNGVEPGFKAVAFIAAAMYVESPGLRVVAKVYPFLQGVGRCAGPARSSQGLPVSAGRWPLRWASWSDCQCRRRSGTGSSRQRDHFFLERILQCPDPSHL